MHPDCDPVHPAPQPAPQPHIPRHERHPAPAPRRQPSGRDGCLRRLPRTHRPAYVGRAVPPHGHTPGLPAPQRIAPASGGWMDGWLSRLLATPRIRGRAGAPEGRSMLRRCSEARPKLPISLRTTVQVLRARRHPRHLCGGRAAPRAQAGHVEAHRAQHEPARAHRARGDAPPHQPPPAHGGRARGAPTGPLSLGRRVGGEARHRFRGAQPCWDHQGAVRWCQRRETARGVLILNLNGGAGVYFNFDAFDVFLESRIKAARAVKCVGGSMYLCGQINGHGTCTDADASDSACTLAC
eukprot:scaffold77004_cov63-Phaeocystis_antarctica.AAC.1